MSGEFGHHEERNEGRVFAFVVVIFVLLVIIGTSISSY
jgi:uncharacterized protein (TIGR01732 family)